MQNNRTYVRQTIIIYSFKFKWNHNFDICLQIEQVFTQVFGYVCNVESISQDSVSQAEDGSVTTTAVTHFIDESKDEPVLASVIQGYKLKWNSMMRLIYTKIFLFLGLALIIIRRQS